MTDQVQTDGFTLTTPYIWVQRFHLFEPLFVCGLKSSQSTPSPSSSSSFHRSCGFRELWSHVGYFLPSVSEVLMFLCMAAVRPPGVVGLSQPQFVPPLACLNVTLVVWYPSSLVVGVFLSSF